MMILNGIRIGRRLALAFSAIFVLVLILAGVGLIQLGSVKTDLEQLGKDRIPMLQKADDWAIQVLTSTGHTRNMLVLENRQQILEEVKASRETRKLRRAYGEFFEKSLSTDEGRALLARLGPVRLTSLNTEEAYLKLIEEERYTEAKSHLRDTMRPAQLALLNEIKVLRNYVDQRTDNMIALSSQDAGDAGVTMLAVSIAIAVLCAILGWVITQSIVTPLQDAVNVADQVAAGDLDANFDASRKDEIGQLLNALQSMVGAVKSMIIDVRSASEQVAVASAQIATGNADLSSRTESQASSLEQTAAAIDELDGSVKQNSTSTHQATSLANMATGHANRGGEVVNQVVGAMGEIQNFSHKIADIISIIDGIAFQTNILALNAAVEAARAGEQGRGFAVVAGEVRSLAHRSAEAAKQIKSLIEESVKTVDSGGKLVREAGAAMEDIVSSVQRVAGIISEISVATGEQSSGISQVNVAVSQLDQMTQQNSALVEQSAAAAASLRDQAQQLMQAIGRFRARGSAT